MQKQLAGGQRWRNATSIAWRGICTSGKGRQVATMQHPEHSMYPARANGLNLARKIERFIGN
jgi:hypothetical protein